MDRSRNYSIRGLPESVYLNIQETATNTNSSMNQTIIWALGEVFKEGPATVNLSFTTSSGISLGSGAINAITTYGPVLDRLAEED